MTTAEPNPANVSRAGASGLVRAAHRSAEVVAFEDALVGFFVDAADVLGVPKSVAAIYAICFASAEPLSFSQIKARLDISSGSISQGLRVLKEVGALKVRAGAAVTSDHGASQADRRDGYEPDLELRNLVLRWMEKRVQLQLEGGTHRLADVVAAIPKQDPAAAAQLADRLHALQTWHNKARALLPFAKTFLKLT